MSEDQTDAYLAELARVIPVKDLLPIYFNERSKVYKGVFEEKPVAIKINTKKGIVQNINKEIAILKTIKHPCIVKYEHHGRFKTFWNESVRYLIEEFIEGETISRRVDCLGAIHWETAVDYLYQICDFLKTIHEKKCFIADLKPDNIFITPQKKIKFVDFGTVKKEPYNLKGIAPGTIGYMCPDWMLYPQVDSRVDIYGLGIIVYEMLTGKLPFKKELETAEEEGDFRYLLETYMDLHMRSKRPSMDNVPERLERIYLNLMEPRRIMRYQSINEVLEDLEKV